MRASVSLVLVVLLMLPCWASAHAQTQTLTRGINITNWFRYPPSRDPVFLANYIGDHVLTDLHTAGFDFVRLAIDPDVVAGAAPASVLIAAIRRVQSHGLAVIVSPHPNAWHLEASAADRDRLRAFWRRLAPRLAVLDQTKTLPEVLNEPVFPKDPAAWALLQHQILGDIRHALPRATIVLTGQDWGSISGLLAVTPEADRNVLYSFHFYDPSELTSLAAYRHDVDRASLSRLPFPADDRQDCDSLAAGAADAPTRDLMHYYCTLDWNAARIGAEIDRAADWSRRQGVRLLAGEFGASLRLNPQARSNWLKTVRAALQARHIAWALWGYDDIMGFAANQPPGPEPILNPRILSALGMPTAK